MELRCAVLHLNSEVAITELGRSSLQVFICGHINTFCCAVLKMVMSGHAQLRNPISEETGMQHYLSNSLWVQSELEATCLPMLAIGSLHLLPSSLQEWTPFLTLGTPWLLAWVNLLSLFSTLHCTVHELPTNCYWLQTPPSLDTSGAPTSGDVLVHFSHCPTSKDLWIWPVSINELTYCCSDVLCPSPPSLQCYLSGLTAFSMLSPIEFADMTKAISIRKVDLTDQNKRFYAYTPYSYIQ